MAQDYWLLERKDGQGEVRLPQDMQWSDEFGWSKVAQAAPQRTLSGGIVIQEGVKLNGRPITLEGEWAWIERNKLDTLRGWSDNPNLGMYLTHYDGRRFDVVFRLHDGGSVFGRAEPVLYSTPETGSEKYTATIKLMTV